MIGRRGLVIVVFASLVTGGAIGLVGGILFARNVFLGPPPGRPGWAHGAPAAGPPPMPLGMLRQSLDLSPGQEERVRAQIQRSRGEFEAIRESVLARVERELTPEQRARWRELQRRFPEPGRRRGRWARPNPAVPGAEGDVQP
jgi:hypothetical protein